MRSWRESTRRRYALIGSAQSIVPSSHVMKSSRAGSQEGLFSLQSMTFRRCPFSPSAVDHLASAPGEHAAVGFRLRLACPAWRRCPIHLAPLSSLFGSGVQFIWRRCPSAWLYVSGAPGIVLPATAGVHPTARDGSLSTWQSMIIHGLRSAQSSPMSADQAPAAPC